MATTEQSNRAAKRNEAMSRRSNAVSTVVTTLTARESCKGNVWQAYVFK